MGDATSTGRAAAPALLERHAIVIPVYNHAAALGSVVRRALELGVPVFVVDDGSTDGSAALAEALQGVTLLRHAENRGKGAALLTGMRAAAAVADWAITIDADGQHDPREARTLATACPLGVRAIVVGHRMQMTGRAVPWTSRFGRGFSNFWVRASGGPRMADSQCGFRIYPLPEVLDLRTRARRFELEVEVLALAAWSGISVLEAPISVDYAPPGGRVSHFRPLRDFWRNAVTFTRLIVLNLLVPRRRRSIIGAQEPRRLGQGGGARRDPP